MSRDLSAFDFNVLDASFNLSDHILISCKFQCVFDASCVRSSDRLSSVTVNDVPHLRWDKGNLSEFKCLTGQNLRAVYDILSNNNLDRELHPPEMIVRFINTVYDKLAEILYFCAEHTVPKAKKNFFFNSGGIAKWMS